MIRRKHSLANDGFTILELMVATSVLSILLLLASAVFISLGTLYTKGVTGTHLQDNVRNILQVVGGTIQYSNAGVVSSGGVATQPQAYCIGGQRFSFIKGTQQGTGTPVYKHVLWQDSDPNPGGTCKPAALTADKPSANGKDLGLDNEILYKFDISQTDPTSVDVWGVLLPGSGSDLWNSGTGLCRSGIGNQFCFTSELSTTVERRAVAD